MPRKMRFTDCTAEERETLISLYAEQPLAADDLAHTKEEDKINQVFNSKHPKKSKWFILRYLILLRKRGEERGGLPRKTDRCV